MMKFTTRVLDMAIACKLLNFLQLYSSEKGR